MSAEEDLKKLGTVVFCYGANIYRDVLENLGFRKFEDHAQLTRYSAQMIEPTIIEMHKANVFRGVPHAYLTIIKEMEHVWELNDCPKELIGHVVPIVHDYAKRNDGIIQHLMQAGAHPVGTLAIENNSDLFGKDGTNPLMLAILAALNEGGVKANS